MTKRDEAELFEKLGFKSSLKQTWFCYKPIDNGPCGLCNPCLTAIRDGMEWRLSAAALKRYRKRMLLIPYYKGKIILRNILGKLHREKAATSKSPRATDLLP
jgi:7-cyano-7-deazaguanine synthase